MWEGGQDLGGAVKMQITQTAGITINLSHELQLFSESHEVAFWEYEDKIQKVQPLARCYR